MTGLRDHCFHTEKINTSWVPGSIEEICCFCEARRVSTAKPVSTPEHGPHEPLLHKRWIPTMIDTEESLGPCTREVV